jgi:hypothetical protein
MQALLGNQPSLEPLKGRVWLTCGKFGLAPNTV